MDKAEIKQAVEKLPEDLQSKWQYLLNILNAMESVVVAFSGGVDSALLSVAAFYELGDKMAAVTIDSPVNSPEDISKAKLVADEYGFDFIVLPYNDLKNEQFILNSPERCYYCKLDRFRELKQFSRENGFAQIIEGSNVDDKHDYRPGRKAVLELGIGSPLVDASLSKKEIRLLAKSIGLMVWDRPSVPCMATRFPYNMRIDKEKLEVIRNAEAFLAELGFSDIRVRVEESGVRIEVDPEQIMALVEKRSNIVGFFKKFGIKYISLDLEGYRMGSMNEVLE